MKTTLFIPFLTAMLCLTAHSCTQEESIHAELETPIYDTTDNPADFVQHTRHVLFKEFRTYLISNPQTRDYKFNFQNKNNLLITPPVQSEERLKKGIGLLNEAFLDLYSNEFKKKHLPFSIILADSILFLGQETGRPSLHAYASNRFLAIAGIRKEMDAYTNADKQTIKGEVNARFWIDYLEGVTKAFTVPEAFFEVSKAAGPDNKDDYYKKNWEQPPTEIDFYQFGFVSYHPGLTSYDENEGLWWVQAPDQSIDKQQWIAFIFGTPKAKVEEIISKYPLMKKKYDLLKAAFLKCDNYDITKLP